MNDLEKTISYMLDGRSFDRSITQDGLIELLAGVRGSTFCNLLLVTVPELRVSPYKDRIIKLQYVTVGLCQDFFKAAKKAGVVKSTDSSAVWHKPVLSSNGKLTAFSRHKYEQDKVYVRAILYPSKKKPRYLDSFSLTRITKKSFDDYLPKRKREKIKFRTISLDSIKAICINNEIILVKE